MAKIEFNEELHQYKLDGQVIPGVTGILKATGFYNFDNIPKDNLDHARERGKVVHTMCHLHDIEDLDITTVNESLMPYLKGWIKFCKDYSISRRDILSEMLVWSSIWKFGGHLDKYVLTKDFLIDVKVTAALDPVVALQTAGYKIALAESTGRKAKKRFGVQLLNTGDYKIAEYKVANDERTFLSALSVMRWQNLNIKGRS